MKLTVVKEKAEKAKYSRRGKNSKQKGANYERKLALRFKEHYGIELKRTPQSGGFAKTSEKADDFRGDITLVDDRFIFKLHVEAKDRKTWSLKEWIRQAESDCPEGRIPIVVFHEYGTGNDYVTLSLDDFFKLIPKSNIIEKRKFR